MELTQPDLLHHKPFIRRTFELARQSVNRGNHPFGALLVHRGRVILEAENRVMEGGDVTAHAELELVRLASTSLPAKTLENCTLYTSTEPCPMCAGAIFWSGIGHIVYSVPASTLLNHTGYGMPFSCQSLYQEATRKLKVEGPILEAEGMQLHENFW